MSLFRKSEGAAPRQNPSVQAIDVIAVYALVTKGTVTLIDVRQTDEWADTGRPASSHGITLQDNDFLDQLSQLVEGDKAAAIAFICKGGGRSSLAAKRAHDAGYTDVYNVVGGFQAWTGADLP
jgi:hydroxyacylglutathione hydrolase